MMIRAGHMGYIVPIERVKELNDDIEVIRSLETNNTQYQAGFVCGLETAMEIMKVPTASGVMQQAHSKLTNIIIADIKGESK